MATSIRARKAVLTRQSAVLSGLIDEYNSLGEVAPDDVALTRLKNKLNAAQVHIRTVHGAVEKALYAFTAAIDQLEEPPTTEEEECISDYIEKANLVLTNSDDLLARMEVQKEIIRSKTEDLTEDHPYGTFAQNSPGARTELPKLPIPEFSGVSWQWDNFWELFNASVHSRPISDLQKFNYLLRALKGEARESAERYQVSAHNYPLLVEHLKKKYGNVTTIVTSLHERLETCSARSDHLRDQSKLFDRICSLTEQLRNKGENLDTPWLLSKILSKFERNIQRRVLEKKVSLPEEEKWSLAKLTESLEIVLNQEEEIQRHIPRNKAERRDWQQQSKKNPIQQKIRSPFCFYCDSKEHWSTACTKVKTPKERVEYLKKVQRCLGCGSKSHAIAECTSKGCTHCGKKHHSSVCFKNSGAKSPQHRELKKGDREKRTTQNFSSSEEPVKEKESASEPTILTVSEKPISEKSGTSEETFLLTGWLRATNPLTNETQDVQVLLDTGADRSFIDLKLAKELQLPEYSRTTLKLTTFGATAPREIECILTHICVQDVNGQPYTLKVFTHDILTSSRSNIVLDKEDLKFIRRKRIKLSSSRQEGHTTRPQILIGCDQLWSFINFEKPHFNLPSGLLLIPTKFGYMVSGQKTVASACADFKLFSTINTLEVDDSSQPWEQQWKFEPQEVDKEFSGPEKEEKAQINAQVMEQFNNTVQRRSDGYYVKIPFKEGYEELPDNKALAMKRLRSTVLRYKDNPDILRQYDEVFKDQLKKGILEEVDESKDTYVTKKHYLAHQPVITPNKETTKFRVVFDASAHYKGSPSLNEVIHQGPSMVPKLSTILLRFRAGKYVMISDVEKAFLQVRIQEDDRDFTRCLWVKNTEEPVTEDNLAVYKFTRITFGINASPFLLSATIHFHLKNFVEKQDLAEEIAENLYVDNLFNRAESMEEAIAKYQQVKTIFADMNMNLREFVSNSNEVMNAIAPRDRSANRITKVLGIPWNSMTDELELKITAKDRAFVSKRTVAQQLASVYDPLGWYIPLLVKAKHFQQQLWRKKYDWDEPLNEEEKLQWLQLIRNINGFQLRIPRRLTTTEESYALVTYTDASSFAMAACTYLVTEEHSHLLMAKSKVTDAKLRATIPKLELNAITMGIRLSRDVHQSLRSTIRINRILILSDSEIGLKWVLSPTKRNNGIYVTNRVKDIKRIAKDIESTGIPVQFGYIDSARNPADCATRGIQSCEFVTHNWWTGYSFRRMTEEGLATEGAGIPEEEGEEMPTAADVNVHSTGATHQNELTDIVDLHAQGTFTKAKRVVAYALRFLKGVTCRLKGGLQQKLHLSFPWLKHEINGQHLTATDILDAQYVLIRNHQLVHVTNQYRKELSKNLNLKEDEFRLLRTYGRLGRSDLSLGAKNPIFIVPKTALSLRIIEEAHGALHRGTAHTMMEVRQTYWIPKLREQVKKVVRQCVPCQRMNNLPYKYPEMTDLPRYRVAKARAFQHTGLDYFGPLSVFREDMVKSNVYGCIFTCAVTRLVHLELVPDGTTEKFLNAFRRFVARRGKPETVTCDNAPTFILGGQVLNMALDEKEPDQLERHMSNNGINWIHITPYSPWKGGFYERLIKAVKGSLFKAIGRRVLTTDQLTTLLTEVEACLNSRPLTYQETEIEDNFLSLRPIDFIQHEMDVHLPLNNISNDDNDPTYLPPGEATRLKTRLQAMKALQSSCALSDRYWKIWKDCYLTALREQHRKNMDNKRGCARQPKEGQIVLITDAFQKRNNWKLGRISKLIQSSDGAIREAEVFCGNNACIRRPVSQLVPLEISEKQNNSGEAETLDEEQHQNPTEEGTSRGRNRYNLRQKTRKEGSLKGEKQNRSNVKSVSTPLTGALHVLISILAITAVAGQNNSSPSSSSNSSGYHLIECRPEGIYLHSPHSEAYEICVNNYCVSETKSPIHQVVPIPASEQLYDYEARWKIKMGSNVTTIETICPAQPFCNSIKCIVCSENILNPECWPLAAIAGLGILLYVCIALCYTLCYVPVTLGRPCRVILKGFTVATCFMLFTVFQCIRGTLRLVRTRSTYRSRRLLEALALLSLMSQTGTRACQTVNVFSHHLKNCVEKSGRTSCQVEMASVLKINPFKKEACIRLQRNHTTVMEMKFYWAGLRLLCIPNHLMYSRNIKQKIVDSKRCPHMGPCVGSKCANISSQSLLPELAIGNNYPGTTGCFESCGGPGCDCFYLSSGCLFYRIYAVPSDNDIYELFSCSKWKEDVKAQVRLRRTTDANYKNYLLDLQPNVPVQLPSVEVTLSVLSWPYLSILDSSFIKANNLTAIWTSDTLPHLQCPTIESAHSLQCNFLDSCSCNPAESQVVCTCKDQDIGKDFSSVRNVLPLTTPFMKFTTHPKYGVMAHMDQGISAEVVVNMKEVVDDTTVVVTDEVCEIPNSSIHGCYRCNRGAKATVTCSSTASEVAAEVDCGVETFTLPCSPKGEETTLHFVLPNARIKLNCSVRCGTTAKYFEITGILKYVHSIQNRLKQTNIPTHNITSDFEWPDFDHILTVYLHWYKTVLMTVAVVLLAVMISYLYLFTACNRLLICVGRALLFTMSFTIRLAWCISWSITRRMCKNQRASLSKSSTKTL